MDTMPDLFPKRLETLIGKNSLRAFARKAEVSEGALRKYLSGKSEPTRPVLIKLARSGGVSLNWLLTGGGTIAPEAEELRASNMVSYVQHVFVANRNRGKGWNSNSVFLAGLNYEHFERLERIARNAAIKDGRPFFFIDATQKTLIRIAEEFTGHYYRTNNQAYEGIEDKVINVDHVVILKNLSKSKISTDKSMFVRSLIKILNDGSSMNIQPASDFIFIDYVSFLEKAWEQIGDYIKINIII